MQSDGQIGTGAIAIQVEDGTQGVARTIGQAQGFRPAIIKNRIVIQITWYQLGCTTGIQHFSDRGLAAGPHPNHIDGGYTSGRITAAVRDRQGNGTAPHIPTTHRCRTHRPAGNAAAATAIIERAAVKEVGIQQYAIIPDGHHLYGGSPTNRLGRLVFPHGEVGTTFRKDGPRIVHYLQADGTGTNTDAP